LFRLASHVEIQAALDAVVSRVLVKAWEWEFIKNDWRFASFFLGGTFGIGGGFGMFGSATHVRVFLPH